MSSVQLGSGFNIQKGNLGGAFDILSGASGDYTDLGIARRFGGAAAAYSLRDIGAMNGRVVEVRRDSDQEHEDFTANQVASGAVEAFVGAGNNGFVSKWYDQSGNGNDAVQEGGDNQPAIVTSGSLNDGLIFDGTNDFLQTSTQVLTGTETGSNGIYAVVNVTSGDVGYVAGSASDDSGVDKVGQSIYASSASSKFILTNGLDADASERDTIAITVGSFVLISACYNNNDPDTLQKNSSTTGYTNGSLAYDFNAGTKFTIGHRERSAGVNPATNLNGSIKEIIAFDIDTTSDRSEIQADIQNHYNL
jgi:hypothetical protein